MKHCLVRTNPKGVPFVGKCIACGMEGITLDKSEGCSNPKGLEDPEVFNKIFVSNF